MKKIKNIILYISLVVIGMTVGACAKTVIAEQTKPLKIWLENENGRYSTLVVVDDSTGVNYVVVSMMNNGGSSVSVSVTPRLNADGTPYVRR